MHIGINETSVMRKYKLIQNHKTKSERLLKKLMAPNKSTNQY